MSQLTQLIQSVANLTNRFNQFLQNAKKVNELPPQEDLNADSLIHVMIDGESQYITVKQVLDAANNDTDSAFAYKSRFEYVDSNTFTIPDGVRVLDARYNGNADNIQWSQFGNQLTYEGDSMSEGDFIIVIGLFSDVEIITDLSQYTLNGGYSGTAQDLADASFKKNIFFTTSLADLGLSTFDELTNEIVADWIDSLEIVENDNEIYYYEITESSGIFDETFDETFE